MNTIFYTISPTSIESPQGFSRRNGDVLSGDQVQQLVWRYTYSDGHTDTWEFYRSGK